MALRFLICYPPFFSLKKKKKKKNYESYPHRNFTTQYTKLLPVVLSQGKAVVAEHALRCGRLTAPSLQLKKTRRGTRIRAIKRLKRDLLSNTPNCCPRCGRISNRSSGIQISRDICTRFGRYLDNKLQYLSRLSHTVLVYRELIKS